jgi:hypothetical protein
VASNAFRLALSPNSPLVDYPKRARKLRKSDKPDISEQK